tara:strand:+ start:639 stop:1076 length:438 start_codon:yes stop_codon:yes gene_type:complete
MSSTWCQNPKCPEKKNSNQIRGIKGSKYYQSNKAYGYGNGNFCTLNCYDTWASIYMDRALIALNIKLVEPVKVSMENAWFIDSDYNYDDDSESRWTYFLANKLFNIKHPITKSQAKILPNARHSECLTSAQAKELANTLGLTQSK